ncbi:MAG: DUF5906 domain-containing protein [Pseudomonadota bacterium]
MSSAEDFLREFHPGGSWTLTCIDPETKVIDACTFDDVEPMRSWIEHWNGTRNIYFSVNPTTRPLTKKAARKDVKEVTYLHVDVDPRAGEDLVEEQARIKALVTTELPDGVPPPTFVVFSGGGYQAFWKLKEPIGIDGDIEKAEDAKLYNIWLERVFGGDSCHNVDRIMRVPGTWNLPDAKKLAKGRVKVEARLELNEREREYDLSCFGKAEPDARAPATLRPILVSTEDCTKLKSVDDLDKWGVPDRVKAVIVSGSDPEDPKEGDNSRSVWLWDVCCNLARCDVPEDVIFAVITDKDFAISESVLDKGSRWRDYALRTIARAVDEVIDPVLCELNQKCMVVKDLGGKCRVVREVNDLGRRKLAKQSFEDFRNAYLNQRVQTGDRNGNPTYTALGKWWLEHPRRRQFERIDFRPESDVEDGVYNLWRGFAVEPAPGTCELFIAHIGENICGGDADLTRYVVSWMARAIQQPSVPAETAIVLRGGQGVGKSFFAKAFGHLFGQHFLHISNAGHVVGNFNAHLRDCVLLFGDEAFYAGDKRHESQLKTLVTEYTLMIEGKGIDAESSRSCLHIILASNKKWVVPADADDRRFLVLDVGDCQKQNSAYFRAIQDQLDSGGYEALLHYLQDFDISEFDHRAIPDTAAKRDQKLRSLDTYQQIIFEMLEEGDSRSAYEDSDGHWVRGPELLRHIRGRSAETNIGRILNAISERKAKRMVNEHGDVKQRWCYLLKPLSRAREAFEDFVGFEIDWSECQGWDDLHEEQKDMPF